VAKQRRFHRNRRARWHTASARWIMTVGKALSAKGKLVDKDFYFSGTLSQDEANALANQKAQQWEVICQNWGCNEQPFQAIFGGPFPDEPRWNADPTGCKKRSLTPGERAQLQQIPDSDYIEAMADFGLLGFIDFYRDHRMDEVSRGDLQGSTLGKTTSQMRLAAKYFPDDVPAKDLRANHFVEAKRKMRQKFAGRTTRNYLSASLELLRFIYARYMGGAGIPEGIRDECSIPKAIRTDIVLYEFGELKELLKATRGTMSQLDLMLALNAGMLPQDIGRLRRDEVDLKDGSVFWDREKEPQNPFRIHHKLWPETLRLLKKYLNDGRTAGTPVLDYRRGKDKPEKLDPTQLAFLDNSKPRYWTTPGGHEKNWVSKRMRDYCDGVSFRALRKTANQHFTDGISTEDSHEQLLAVEELSHYFLGHRTETLVRTYRLRGKAAYQRMNIYLEKLGKCLRAAGVFKEISR